MIPNCYRRWHKCSPAITLAQILATWITYGPFCSHYAAIRYSHIYRAEFATSVLTVAWLFPAAFDSGCALHAPAAATEQPPDHALYFHQEYHRPALSMARCSAKGNSGTQSQPSLISTSPSRSELHHHNWRSSDRASATHSLRFATAQFQQIQKHKSGWSLTISTWI